MSDSYIGKSPQYGYFSKQTLTAPIGGSAITLNATTADTRQLIVVVGGVVQEPETAYTINAAGTQLTFTATPDTSLTGWIIWMGKQTTGPRIMPESITAQTALGTAPAADDTFVLYDDNATSLKKVAFSDMQAAMGDITAVQGGTGITVTNGTGPIPSVAVDASQTQITALGTIASLVATTADINGGTFDGVVGGTTPAAGTFTGITGTQVDITAQGDLRLQDTSGGEHIAIQAAGTTTTYTLTMPAAVATSTGQALTSSTGGVGSWTDVGDAVLANDQNWTGSQRAPLVTDNDGSFDQDGGNNFFCTPSGNVTLTFTNHTGGQSGYILFDNAGAHTVSLHATTKGDANLATTLSTAGTYLVSYLDNGTNAYLTTSAVFA